MSLRWGLIGYGDLAGKRVAAALQQTRGSSLAAVWGRNPQRTEAFASEHGIPKACQRLEDLWQENLDAIYICTPPDSHAAYAMEALRHGCHVLVEKPMATTSAEAGIMVAAAKAAGVQLGVAYYRRAFPKMQKIRELICTGLLGEPVWCNITSHSWFAPAPDTPKHWRVEKERSGGGGALADIGVHRLDLLDYWLGSATVEHAMLTRLVHTAQSAPSYEVEDGACALLKLANGAPVHTFFSWNSKTWIDRFEIVGSEGKIIAEPLDGPELTVIRGREREQLLIPPPANAHLPLVEDFVEACREGRPPICDGSTGLRTTRLLEAILAC